MVPGHAVRVLIKPARYAKQSLKLAPTVKQSRLLASQDLDKTSTVPKTELQTVAATHS